MSRALTALAVVLVGTALAVSFVGSRTSGEGGGRPVHIPDRAATAAGAAGEPGRPPTTQRPAEADDTAPDPQRPTRLVIDSLGVRAPVVPLKTTGEVLYPPDDPAKAGWWRGGSPPGSARGSTVITGHTVSDGDGVFDDLDELRPGDRLQVVTEQGVLRYVVRNAATYRKSTLARRAPQLFSQSSPERLVLVTCEDWNGEVYLSNHVVVATPA